MERVPGFFVRYAWLIPFFPLLGAAVAAFGARRLRSAAHWPVWIGIGLAFLVSLGTLASAEADLKYTVISNWLPAGDLDVPIEMRLDGLSTMMLSMVTFVSGLVAVFAAGYMAGDPGYPRFFALIGLFVFSMTGLVLSNNYLLTYVFWEGVGACSYLLVGFWHSRPSASAAAMKAFLVNRVGDFGFAVAIFWMWSMTPGHDLSYDAVFAAAASGRIDPAAVMGISLLLFWGATAKSAQIPLYVWLPDAMEGPTPVSALIHAATMVTAGVYLIARSMPMIVAAQAPGVQLTIAVIGCATALLAAAIALTQNDLKRVMAYSTVSQLGYMFMALGAGVGDVAQLAVVAAMFHLFTHAFFKALLFLASGSVMHAMGDVIDMRRFRGLRHRMPITCWTFAVGGLALAAIPPLSGFFSKDEILGDLEAAGHWAQRLGWAYRLIDWLAILTAFLTAFYTGRAFFMTFFGPEKLPSPDDPEAPSADPSLAEAHAHGHHAGSEEGHAASHHHDIGHESPPVMAIPLLVLAGCTVLIGLICIVAWPFEGGPAEWFAHHLEKTLAFESLGHIEHGFSWLTALIGTAVGLGGIGLSYVMYAEPSPLPKQLMERFRPLYEGSLHKFYVDEVYQRLVVGPLRGLSVVSSFLDTHLVDRLVTGIALIPRAIARARLATFQNGLIQFYAAVSAMSVAVLLLILILLGFQQP
jgi:proton-translocating NADH-quinone oxidoreductase chain L